MNLRASLTASILSCAVSASALPPASFSSRGIGGGGGLYGPVISPFNPLVMFLGCDMSELFYTTTGGASWNTVNYLQLQAATLTEVQFTSDPQIVYALDSSATAPNGTMVNRPSRSADGGVHWTPCTNWPSPSVCYTVYAAWNSTTRIFAANSSRLYTSNDGGITFNLALDLSTVAGYSSSTKGRLAGAFFDGANVWIGSNLGLLYSNTSGDSFSVATITGFNNSSSEAIVAFCGAKDPSTGTIRFYCVTANASAASAGALPSAFYFQNPQIYRLDGSGANWTATNVFSNSVRNSIASGDYPVPIAMARNNINVVYVAANRPNGTYPDLRTTYKITSAGGAWQRVLFVPNNQNINTGWGGSPSNGRLDYAYPLGICVDPNDANHAIACDDALIEMTTNGGATWQQIYLNSADQNAVNTPISSAKGYRGVGLEPTAAHWIDWCLSGASPPPMLAAYSDMAMIRATDGGTKWFFPGGFSYGDIYQVIHHPTTGTLYAVNSGLISPYFLLGLDDTTYDAAKGAIYYSTNNGASWAILKSYTSFGGVNGGTGAAPVWGTLDAANDRLYVSIAHTVNGGIWRIDNVSLGAGASAPVKLTAPPRTQGHAYVLRILSHGELVCTYSARFISGTGFTQSSGVFYSTDGGASWSDRSDIGASYGMAYYTQEVAIDPYDATENTWYACVWGTIGFTNVPNGVPNPNTLGGVYKTTDRGLHWTRIYSGDSVASVTINPNPVHSDEMYVCTRNIGLVYTSNLHAAGGPTFSQVTAFPFRQPTHVFYNPNNSTELWVTSYGNGLLVGTPPAGSLQFNAATYDATEGQTATITVTRVNGDNGAVSVNYTTSDGTATAGADYTTASGLLNWADGDTAAKTFNVATLTDQLVEGTETANLLLNTPTNGASLGAQNTAILNIADSPFDAWRAQRFGANANNAQIGGPLADPDGDGLKNLLEWGLNTDPNDAASAVRPAPVNVGGHVTLTYSKNTSATDLTWSAEVSSDLVNWNTAQATVLTDNATTFLAQDNTLTTIPGSHFLRVKVTNSFGVSATTEPVGFNSTTALGLSDTRFSAPLHRAIAYQGLVASVSGNIVTVQGAPNWTSVPPQWVYAAGAQTNTYVAEFGSGNKKGRWFYVTANGGSSVTLNLNGEILDGATGNVIAGDTIKIYPCWTPARLFTGLVTGTLQINGTGALTKILWVSPGTTGINRTATSTYYYYSGSSFGGSGWRILSGGFGNIHDNDPFPPDAGMVIRQDNVSAGALITVIGAAPLNDRGHSLGALLIGAAQDTELSTDVPLTLTLAQSQLFEGGAFAGSTAVNGTKGDRLMIFDNTTTGYNKTASKTYYYYTGATFGGPGWRLLGAAFNTIHDGDVTFPAGSSFIVRAAAGSPLAPQPWALPLSY